MAEVKDNLLQLEVVYSKLNKAIDENISRLNIGATAVDNYNKKISVVPSQYQKSLQDIRITLDEVKNSNLSLTKAEKESANAILKTNTVIRSDIATRKAQNAEIERTEKALAKENAKLQASENLYNKLQVKLNSLSNEYKNLASRKELGLSLTAKEEQRYTSLQGRIQTYDKALKAVDGSMGKYQRNVGNYASAFNPLQNSINQLGREMPAFANSVQTGFMAISNNLPIFFDAITHTKNEIIAMRKAGQEVPGLFSQLTSSFLSWGTALSVGVTLLTVYGKEMVKFVSSLWGASDAINELNKNQKEFNESRIQGTKESIKDRTELEKYVKIMRNSNLTTEERAIALKKIRDQFPFYFKGLKDEVLLNGDITKNLQSLNLALERRGILNKAQEANIKNKERLIDLREELRLIDKQVINSKKDLDNKTAIVQSAGVNRTNRLEQLKAEDNYNSVLSKQTRIKNDILAFEKAIALNKKTEIDLAGKTIGLEAQAEEQAKKRIARKKKEKEADEQLLFGTEAWLKAQISAFEEIRSKTAQSSDAYKEVTGAIQYYEKWLQTLVGTQKKSNEETEKTIKYGTINYYEDLISKLKQQQQAQAENNQEFAKIESQIKFYEDLIKAIKGVSDETEKATEKNTDYFNSFVDTFSSESGFSKILDIARGNIKDFGKDSATTALAISEAFQEAFNTISQASQANFEAEYNRLAMQKEIALKFAGESTTAKEEIERQAEEKRKAIARREAESQKRLAIFNIVTNTAQAILATYAKTGFTPAGIAASVAMGLIGAAQVALVTSQEIPQFWKGTDNAPEGLAWTQEKGAEIITDKSGNIKSLGSDKGAQLTYLKQGDKVYKSHEDYINKELAKNGIMPMRQSIQNFTQNNNLSKEDFNNGISKLAKSFKQQETSNTNVYLNNKKINTDYYKGQTF